MSSGLLAFTVLIFLFRLLIDVSVGYLPPHAFLVFGHGVLTKRYDETVNRPQNTKNHNDDGDTGDAGDAQRQGSDRR